MPLYRRLPKRGFKSLKEKYCNIINLSTIQNFYDKKKIDLQKEIDLKSLKSKKIINKKFKKLKILGTGEIEKKVDIVQIFSKQAKVKN